MRSLFVFAGIAAGIAAAITLLYKWRYRTLVILLVFGMLRKIITIISRNMPFIKRKLLPILFQKLKVAMDN